MSREAKFTARIQKSGSRTFVPLPSSPDEFWGVKDRHNVVGVISGQKIRGKIEPFGGHFGLSLGPVWLRDNRLAPGDEVEVSLSPEGPQMENLPEDLANALKSSADAQNFFNGLTTFDRKNYLRWVESAKRPETRANRIREMVERLAAGQRMR